jgi:hypothetical protein
MEGYMSDNSVGFLGDAPNIQYQKFFNSFAEINTLDVKDWGVKHLIGYFCKLYKDKYGCEYKFKFNSTAPSKCYEVFQIKKLGQVLTTDPVKLKKYIDWSFEEKSKFAKRKITSIAFLCSEYLVTEYKLKYLAGDLPDQKIERTTLIPGEYLQIIHQYNYQISNYGELSFLLQMNDDKIKKMSLQLSAAGLDLDKLGKIL